MTLPDFPTVTEDLLQAIVARHGLGEVAVTPMPQVGIFNVIFAVGDDVVLRIPRDHPRFVAATRNEAIAVPLARAAGVRTPALIALDDRLDLLPVPYGLYERVPGQNLEHHSAHPADATPVWRELGGDLARLHAGVERTNAAARLIVHDQKTDPRPLPDLIAEAGYFTAVEARWLSAWLDRLAPFATAGVAQRLLHGDTQATNVIVAPDGTFRAVIDWGSCLWGDVALDFAGIPLRAVPALLEGYRRQSASTDDTLEPRIVWRHLQIALHQLRGKPQPEWSWAERPIGMLLEILRFFAGNADARWREWGPGA